MPKNPWEPLEPEAFNVQLARSAFVVCTYDGTPLDITDSIENLQYVDNASGKIDSITLTVGFRDGYTFKPEKEKELDVTIYLPNWYRHGVTETYHCGKFVIDDITLRGRPRVMTIKGVAEPASSSFKNVKVTQQWQMVTVQMIAQQIMAKYGMTELIFNAADQVVQDMSQDNKSDSEFISELCKKYGLAQKTYKAGFVIFDEAMYEGRDSFSYFGDYPADWATMTDDWTIHEIRPDWTFNSTLQGTYTGAELSYTAGDKGETVKAVVGDPTRLLYLSDKAGDMAEADKIAREKVNEENKKAVTLDWAPTLFCPGLFASYNVDIVNLDERVNGKYYVDTVTVGFSSSGLTMDVKSHKIFPRL